MFMNVSVKSTHHSGNRRRLRHPGYAASRPIPRLDAVICYTSPRFSARRRGHPRTEPANPRPQPDTRTQDRTP